MTDFTPLAERYIACWNETDPAARRAAVDELWASDARYVDPALLAAWRERDPIATYEATLRDAGVDVDAIRARVLERLDAAVEVALATPLPDPSSVLDGLFATEEPVPLGRGDAPWSAFAADPAEARR